MSPRNSYYTFLLFLLLLLLLPACSGRKSQPETLWDTGFPETDSILTLIDSLENPASYGRSADDVDYDRLYMLYMSVDSIHRLRTDSVSQALTLFARAATSDESDFNDIKAYALDSAALGLIDSAATPYLYNRLAYEKAYLNPDITTETGVLYNAVAYFSSINDSILVTDALFALNEAYANIWDEATMNQCYNDIIRFSKAANHQLRSLMKFNILMDKRANDSCSYAACIDSMRIDKAFFDSAPTIGVIIYSDIYRLKGEDAALDTAATYMERLRFYHESKRVYASQRLRQEMRHNAPADSLRALATMLSSGMQYPGTIEIETFPVLRDYYTYCGNSDSAAIVQALLSELTTKAKAYKAATGMTRMNMERHLDRALTDRDIHSSKSRRTWLWISAVTLTIILLSATTLIVRLNRRKRQCEESLGKELELARRRITIAKLQEVEKGQSEDDWERFQAVFVEMHPDFPENLRRACPALTKGDIRMCALLSMDMDTKHIARILGINPESVKKHRQRLRAKFGIPPGTDWPQFLSRF